MNEGVVTKIQQKKSAFIRFKQSRARKDYMDYVHAHNAAKTKLRRAVRDYEKEIAKRAKSNPKAFYQYINSKTKSCVRIPDMKGADGVEITRDKIKIRQNCLKSSLAACTQQRI